MQHDHRESFQEAPCFSVPTYAWVILYVIAVALATLYFGGLGFLASTGLIAIGFYAGWLARSGRRSFESNSGGYGQLPPDKSGGL